MISKQYEVGGRPGYKIEGADTHVMTTPIITKADGTKFGKSEGGAICLTQK